ncbi:MAG: YeeE/YedE family protein [Alphaproteobacteria bacterium]|nr:YeeE/YedE family protein [Alphaproteobacteria bacterium]
MTTEFTPIAALSGGALIGLAAALMMLLSGRIAGISGILGGAFEADTGDRAWRWWFVAGLIAAPVLALIAGYGLPKVALPSWPVLIVAALLVGFGTRMGNGCTSGHGVCGIARLSPRSLAATLAFMAAAVVTVFVMRHVMGG